jgi:hypothetical protein
MLEKKISLYKNTFNLELTKTEKNTFRIKFLGLDPCTKAKKIEQPYIDLVISDSQILIHSSKPVLKKRLELQESLNFHKRLDIFISDTREQFSSV